MFGKHILDSLDKMFVFNTTSMVLRNIRLVMDLSKVLLCA